MTFDEPTMTLGQVQKIIAALIVAHGEEYPIRVDTTYDQGMDGMPITDITEEFDGYISIKA